MIHQKRPSEARSTTATGTTMAGIKVPRLLEPALLAACDVAAADGEDVVVEVAVRDDRLAASAVSEAYWAESVTMICWTVVLVDMTCPPTSLSVCSKVLVRVV